jgi:hypothetical protein
MLRGVALVRTDVSEEPSASFIRLTRIGELGTTLAVTSNRRTLRRNTVTASVILSSPILVALMKETLISYETSFLQELHGVTSQKTPFLTETSFHRTCTVLLSCSEILITLPSHLYRFSDC